MTRPQRPRPIPSSSRRGERRVQSVRQQSGTPLERDWQAMRQVLMMLKSGAVRMWGEIGRTT